MRAYFWKAHEDEDTGMGVIADSVKEAKKLGFSYWSGTYGVECDTFIEQRCTWIKKAKIKGMSKA